MTKARQLSVALLALVAALTVSCAGSSSVSTPPLPTVAVQAPVDTAVPARPSDRPNESVATSPAIQPTTAPENAAQPTQAARPSTSNGAPQQPAATRPPLIPAPQQKRQQIFLIALNDDGKTGKPIGCGDSVVPVQVNSPGGLGVLKNALEALLAIKTQTYGQSGLYSALYQANLQVAKVTIVNGNADIRLTGKLTLGGVCDSPRVKAQLEETARQFSTVKSVSVFVNNVALDSLISATGE